MDLERTSEAHREFDGRDRFEWWTQARESIEIFEQHLDSLPFDEAVEAVRGLRAYQAEVQAERDIVAGRVANEDL